MTSTANPTDEQQVPARRQVDAGVVVALLGAALGLGAAGGGAGGTMLTTGKLEAKLERIESLLSDLRADARDHDSRLRQLELWRASLEARASSPGPR